MTLPIIHIETPVYESAAINQRLGKRILLKMDCYQPTGSFKARGIGHKVRSTVESGQNRLISSSGGNAGITAAYAARVLGAHMTVILPENASETARQRIIGDQAEVAVHGPVWDDADAYARQLAAETGAAYIHPFDDPVVWEGHTTLIEEAARQVPVRPDVVVVAVGGAGLLSGVVQGMKRYGWEDVPVLAVETFGADSFATSIKAGEHLTLPAITSIANTLGARKVTARAIEWAGQHEIVPQVVTDAQAVDAALRFADDWRVVVEPACGAALSLIYDNAHLLDGYQNVFMVVCGGAGVTLDMLYDWHKKFSE